MNSTLDPVPNPLGPPVLSLAAATTGLQQSLDQWNALPSSFIEMHVGAATTTSPGLRGFDMINELTFRTAAGFSAIASSPSVNLIADTTLVDGDDIDGDGDSDVSSAIATVTDADTDGDSEFPAGFYKAGTILDNDVQFNTKVSNGFRFTLGDAALDTVTRSVGLQTVAVHEFGHSFGLSHSMTNQKSGSNGDGATNVPLHRHRRAGVGTAAADHRYGRRHHHGVLLSRGNGRGRTRRPADRGRGIRGGLRARRRHGHARRAQPAGGGSQRLRPGQDDRHHRQHGLQRHDAPVLQSRERRAVLHQQPCDCHPGHTVRDGPAARQLRVRRRGRGRHTRCRRQYQLYTALIGNSFGQQNFQEEFFKANVESAIEKRTGQAGTVHVDAGQTVSGVNIVTNIVNVSNYGNLTNIGDINSPSGRIYAVRIPKSQLNTVAAGGAVNLQAAIFDTHHVDASQPVTFAEAMITSGFVTNGGLNATINLADPLVRAAPFVAQDGDFAPLFVKNPHDTDPYLFAQIAAGAIEDVFVVLRLPSTPYAGVSGQPPLIGLSNIAPLQGLSYVSSDGGATFAQVSTLNFRFGLVFSQPSPQ